MITIGSLVSPDKILIGTEFFLFIIVEWIKVSSKSKTKVFLFTKNYKIKKSLLYSFFRGIVTILVSTNLIDGFFKQLIP